MDDDGAAVGERAEWVNSKTLKSKNKSFHTKKIKKNLVSIFWLKHKPKNQKSKKKKIFFVKIKTF
jgi:hypothetical protein